MSMENRVGDPEALHDGIRQTRAELGETVQALVARADVKARLRESAAQTGQRLREQAAQTAGLMRSRAGRTLVSARATAHDAGLAARRNPVPWVAVLTGATAVLLALMLRRRRR
jgi:hypothetical protein